MLINREVFSIPPHISTSWGHVVALYMEENTLVVCLTDSIVIKIPNLPGQVLEKIYDAHAAHLSEQNEVSGRRVRRREVEQGPVELPLRFGFGFGGNGTSLDNMLSNGMQHNPEQAHMPDIPAEILEKITTITKLIAPDDVKAIPKGEPHCNCMFCQVSRALHTQTVEEEVVEDQLFKFDTHEHDAPESLWIIEPVGEFCYNVKNRADELESYKVFIKEGQVGCNCGKHGCEHIIAVLRS